MYAGPMARAGFGEVSCALTESEAGEIVRGWSRDPST